MDISPNINEKKILCFALSNTHASDKIAMNSPSKSKNDDLCQLIQFNYCLDLFQNQ